MVSKSIPLTVLYIILCNLFFVKIYSFSRNNLTFIYGDDCFGQIEDSFRCCCWNLQKCFIGVFNLLLIFVLTVHMLFCQRKFKVHKYCISWNSNIWRCDYCRTLFFRCILISWFSYVENSLHFNFADFPVGPILARMHWSYDAQSLCFFDTTPSTGLTALLQELTSFQCSTCLGPASQRPLLFSPPKKTSHDQN